MTDQARLDTGRALTHLVDWAVAVRYEGRLSGGGRITLRRRRRHATKVTWSAQVRLPWLLGGPIGAVAAAQLLRVVWKLNLANLARAVT